MNKIVITTDMYVTNKYNEWSEKEPDKTFVPDEFRKVEAKPTATELNDGQIMLIRDNILAAYNAGASAVHLHAVNYADIKELMSVVYQECPEILIIPELISSGSNIDGELEVIEGEPELAVLKCDMSMTGNDTEGAEDNMRRLGQAMLDNGVRPLLECCDKGMVDTVKHFYKEGWLTDPLIFLFRLGVKAGMDQSIDNLLHLKNSIPQNSSWSVLASSEKYMDTVAEAVLMGGNVSISGAECGAAELADRVGKAAALIRQLGRDTANPAEARRLMSLNTKYRRVIDNHLL